MVRVGLCRDACHNRGSTSFLFFFFSERRGSLTQNRRENFILKLVFCCCCCCRMPDACYLVRQEVQVYRFLAFFFF